MTIKKWWWHERRANEEPRTVLSPGVRLLSTLEGHRRPLLSVAFDSQGGRLASGSYDRTVKLWEAQSGDLLRTLKGHQGPVYCVAFDPQGRMLASGSGDNTVKLWDAQSGKLLRTLEGHHDAVTSVAFRPQGGILASGSSDNTVNLWEAQSGQLLRTLVGHQGSVLGHQGSVYCVAFDPQGRMLASGGRDQTVKLWEMQGGQLRRTLEGWQGEVLSVAFDPQGGMLAGACAAEARSDAPRGAVTLWDATSGKLLRTLEGHTHFVVDGVAFSSNGRLLASNSRDDTIRLWSCETWDTVAVIPDAMSIYKILALAFPALPLLATAAGEEHKTINLWELDLDVLLGERAGVAAAPAVHHTTGKIVLVGDHSVGKSALGYSPIHGAFNEQASTHGQQFWVFPALGQRRKDGTEYEAEQRTRFEQAIFRVRAYVAEQQTTPPETFISYAWGVPEHEHWVEKRLATDLQKAGIEIVLDRWHNAQIGKSVPRFAERIEKSDRIIVVGTPAYRRKYENKDTSTGYVVAAEVDLIDNRLLGTEPQKQTVLPLLLDGEKADSLPPLLHGRVYADFRDELAYFATAFDLILSLYQLPVYDPAVADLRESVRGRELR